MYTQAPGEPNVELDIFGNGISLRVVNTFVYLGSILGT